MRIIVRLDLKGKNLIKSIMYEGVNVIGPLEKFAKKYYLDGADELIYIDTVASLYERIQILDIIKKSTNDIFIPITVGGGIKNIQQVKDIFNSGADKIAINTYAVKNPEILRQISEIYGSQAVVVSIQAKKRDNYWEVFTENGREPSGLSVEKWCRIIEDKGAGEIFLSSIDKDGTLKGPDFDLIKLVSNIVKIPIIASSGIGSIDDVVKIKSFTNCSAVAIGSAFHYNKIEIINLKNAIQKN
jgi:imidazole glycerol-phosphate synthase subunit HisF